jgi:hypothetical protein
VLHASSAPIFSFGVWVDMGMQKNADKKAQMKHLGLTMSSIIKA